MNKTDKEKLVRLVRETLELMQLSSNVDPGKVRELQELGERIRKRATKEALGELFILTAPRGYLGDCPLVPKKGSGMRQEQMSGKQDELVEQFEELLYPYF